MATCDVWAVSLHHALGGRPLWLVVAGARNGTEAQANAALAGLRLSRTLGGFNGLLALDGGWAAYFVRCNEACLVATFPAHGDAAEAVRAAEAARAAVVDACGGRAEAVTLAALGRLGAEVQLALRKAVLGFGRVQGLGVAASVGGGGSSGSLAGGGGASGGGSGSGGGLASGSAGGGNLASAPSSGFDFSSISISPELPSDATALSAMRLANDVANPQRYAAAMDLFAAAAGKGELLGEALRTQLRPPASAFGSPIGSAVADAAADAAAAGARCARPSRALLGLVPPDALDDASAPPSPVVSRPPSPAADEADEQLDFGVDASGGARAADWMNDASSSSAAATGPSGSDADAFLWEPSAEAVTAEEDWGPPPEPPMPEACVSVRLAAQISETVTISGRMGAGASPLTDHPQPPRETAATEAAMVLKFMYAAPLSDTLQATGHGALPFYLALRSQHPLASVTLSGAGANAAPQAVEVPQQPEGTLGPVLTLVPLMLPARPPNFAGNAAQDLVTLTYRYPPSYVPAVFRAQTLCRRAVEGGSGGGGSAPQRFTDVILKTALAPGVLPPGCSASQVSFLLQLPPLSPAGAAAGRAATAVRGGRAATAAAAAEVPSSDASSSSSADIEAARYGDPVCKPRAQWVAARAQLLWALVEGDTAPAPGDAESNVPRTRTFFAPGRPAEFRARVPILSGEAESEPAPGAVTSLPLQVRFVLTNGAVAAALPEVPAGAGGTALEQPQCPDAASGHRVRVVVASVLSKASSQVRGLWR